MLISEFESINRDILLDPVQPNELLNACTDGTVFFLVTTSRSKKPVKDRPVLYARFVMPIWFSETEKYVEFLGITDSRNLLTLPMSKDRGFLLHRP